MTDEKVGAAGVSDYAKLLRKINSLRGEVVKCDWTADGIMKIQGTPIHYIPITKMRTNIAPLFGKVGLEFIPEMKEPVFNSECRQWVVPMTFELVDVDTGCSKVYSFTGAGDGSKGLVIGEAFALKLFLSTVFLLADGIDPDRTSSSSGSMYVPKTNSELETVKSKIDENAIKIPKDVTVANPMTGKASEPAPAPAEGTPKPKSTMQARSIARILESNEAAVSNGEMTADECEKIKNIAETIVTYEEARSFITKYKAN